MRLQPRLDGSTSVDNLLGMSTVPKAATKPEPATKGTEIGARLRARTNKLSDSAREAARLRGMQLIYGNGGSDKVHAHSR
jgi:hypothetical protein